MDASVPQGLIARQFPAWASLPIRPVARSGWDNHTFHLGTELLIRLPSGAGYAAQVAKEQHWLPQLAPALPVAIPEPIAQGEADASFPYDWSVYRWLPGAALADASKVPAQLPAQLATFLTALQGIDSTGGPGYGEHNHQRGGPLAFYAAQAEQAIAHLSEQSDTRWATSAMAAALASRNSPPDCWLHGDIAPGNLLIGDTGLCGVIDFGLLAVGDPACDYAIAWTTFDTAQRATFRDALAVDKATWHRARGWALWKALIVHAGLANGQPQAAADAVTTLAAIREEIEG